jgi:hypothetical protein
VLVRGGRTIVCTENLASWHNIAALVVGLQPFSRFRDRAAWGTGYHPLPKRLAAHVARLDARHAHFIAVVARAS